MYTYFFNELNSKCLNESHFWESFYKKIINPPINSLMPVNKETLRVSDFSQSPFENTKNNQQKSNENINLILRLIDNPNFMVSVSTKQEEIAVWDLFT